MASKVISAKKANQLSIKAIRNNLIWKERIIAQEQAEKVIIKAKQRAKVIVNEAESKVVQAILRGKEAGKELGFRQVAKDVAEVIRWRKLTVEKHLSDLVKLATEMARRILRRELKIRPESIHSICKGVIKENLPGRRLVIIVSPNDLKILKQNAHSLICDENIMVGFEVSDHMKPGDCIIRGELGEDCIRCKSTRMASSAQLVEPCANMGRNQN